MILFLSNGAGEDAIASRIASYLEEWGGSRLAAFPLVGQGASYSPAVQRFGVVRTSPSGGLSNESWGLLVHDLRSGLLTRLGTQFLKLRSLRREVDLLVAVGDVLTVILAGLAGHRRILFVGTAKSNYHHAYSKLESWVLGRWCTHIFTRDQLTADDLAGRGLSASWVGNAMMDGLEPTPLELGVAPGEPCLALFPGSRAATYEELPRLLLVYQQLAEASTGAPRALVALADSIDVGKLGQACPGWRLEERKQSRGLVGILEKPGLQVGLVRGALGDVLAHSQVALGQAGTAHEQAAGMGIPVVALHPPGRPLGWYRGRQKGLLGEALWVVEPRAAVEALSLLFRDGAERARRGAVGRQRMGPPGGARRMAEWIAGR